MKTSVVEKGQWARELAVEVPSERIDAELDKAYRKYQKRIEIPGFRKGKVPLRVIKTRYGEEIRGQVISDMLPTLLQEAAREAGLKAAAPPTISDLDYEPGQELKFTAQLDVWPEIEVEDIDGLELSRMTHQVTDEEVDQQLEQIRNRQASERTVERPLGNGDVLIADLQRLDDSGVAIIGERFEERRFVLGEDDAPSPEFEQALVGISADEERDVRFSYRDDLSNEELAGTRDHFLVKAREVRERVLPELDDEFAKDVGEEFTTLDELRQHIRSTMERRWEEMARQRLRQEAMDRLMVRTPFELPESLVQSYVQSMRHQMAQQRGDHDHDHDHDETPPSEEEQKYAEQRLRTYLLLEAVRRKEGVEASDEELDAFLTQRAAEIGMDAEALKRSGRLDDLRRELEDNKVYELLIERAKLSTETV